MNQDEINTNAAAGAAASAAALVFTTAFAVVATMAAAEAADAAAVPAAAGKASKCPEKQQTKKSQPHLELAPPLAAVDQTRINVFSLPRFIVKCIRRVVQS